MKGNLTILFILLFTNIALAQVGINTPNPTQTLDVDGTARIRQTPLAPSIGTSNLLISQTNGDVYQIDPSVLTKNLKIPTTVLSTRLVNPVTTPFAGGNVINQVRFDTTDIIPNTAIGNWNSANNTFTVNMAGVYQISASILLANFTNADANFTIQTTPYNQNSGGLLLAGNKYTVNQVLALKLNPGDTVRCNIITGGANSFNEQTAIMSIIYTPL
ncbi:hypothetical protein [Chryseobacterium gleum]|uniref:hypothetical protein n=1 Tax=Chryseobacterium TaxID=59732 RepID=UPI0028B242F5|nr:hypothetical protein [Chryseobacterium gleum]